MAAKSSRSSRSSLVSIDPAIASHIAGTKILPQSAHVRTESTPAKSLMPPPAAHSHLKSHGRNNSAPIRNHRRSNSLRRAKNSTEMLRQRSTKKERQTSGDHSSDSKRGRNFTVTNVGTGGVLYLRPSAHQTPMSPALSPPPATPWTAPATTLLMPDENKDLLLVTERSSPGRGPTSRTRSVSPKRLMQRFNKTKEAQATASRPTHGRSQSFSTMDESRKSLSGSMPKTLKIVINRAEQPRPRTSDSSKPTLEIPIPHYRLGNPRFSSNGTPMLRSSTYTRTSSTPSTKHASMIKTEAPNTAPPPASLKAFAKLQTLDHASESAPDSNARPLSRQNASGQHRASAISSIGAAPSIYEELSEVYNDPSVVRFAHDIKEITAATPARIIAQISSESFMDYELVSDFFLTFRSYMSTIDVLDLLLARLKWAIARMTDDGRIIRIRTFAALRHWILNYFMDDFVPNRHLRDRFCEEVNEMYDEVKRRHTGGQSDLKILQDLKRCWNGRCSLYWDGTEFSMDGSPDDEVHPGGVLGSRNPAYREISQVRPMPTQAVLHAAQATSPASGKATSPKSRRQIQHRQQQASQSLSGPPESVQSEQSIQPNSCSVPLTSNWNQSEAQRSSKGPQVVSVLARRQNAPAELTVSTNLPSGQRNQHKRGGNSIDSTRERTPNDVPKSAVLLQEPFEGSVIRGYVYGPVEPFVQIPAHLPMSPSGRFESAAMSLQIHRTQHDHSLSPGSPIMKNIFGSIRRALSGKQGLTDVALISVSTQSSTQSSTQTLGGKKSPMPLNVPRSQDEMRRKAAVATPKGNIRIDLLCAAAIESYQVSRPALRFARPSTGNVDTDQPGVLFPSPPVNRYLAAGDLKLKRVPSNGSGESGSILIVNDTENVEMPVMSGALGPPHTAASERTHSSSDHYAAGDDASFETQIAFQDEHRAEQAQRSSPESSKRALENAVRLPVTPEPHRVLSSTASSTTIRNRHSLSSSVAPNRMLASPGATVSIVTPPQDYNDDSATAHSKAFAHTLRRRPGGDLRKNQNVHDLEPVHVHHESLDSQPDTISTTTESVMTMGNVPTPHQHALPINKRVSMINTHSSQHLRPSFEAAVAGFSDIPDDDDGGLEATLLKLEGRYDKNSPDLGRFSPMSADIDSFPTPGLPIRLDSSRDGSSPIIGRGYTHQAGSSLGLNQRTGDLGARFHGPSQAQLLQHQLFGPPLQSSADSVASEDSLPILKRGTFMPQTFLDAGEPYSALGLTSPADSILPKLQDRAVIQGSRPNSDHETNNSNIQSGESFLLEADDRSDLSSELSVDIINYSEAMGASSSPMLVAPGTAVSGLEIPSHPLAHSSFINLSMHPSLALDSKSPVLSHPPSPEPSPILLRAANGESITFKRSSLQQNPIGMQRGGRISAGPAHVPFVLACDSQVLAQQLTLVEQSALTEIEWSDLVEMRWSNTAASILDWAEYVSKSDVKGVDLVITRFNLMVKWALSEIVLTQDLEERVKVISKFIHVAAHARGLHNYATMLQLTIALTSTDCTRMKKTWESVPGPDRSLLKNMEALIQPVRNFHDLRLEMESADLSDGCIPFIGLYIHDLTYNAQKPVEIDIGKGQAPLINFERFRTSAIIVKGLLRLIDASSRYEFDPIHGVIERCLWIAALSDERIRSLSRSLQQ